jgi:hypothetical protein
MQAADLAHKHNEDDVGGVQWAALPYVLTALNVRFKDSWIGVYFSIPNVNTDISSSL